jgi:hypothetical protein
MWLTLPDITLFDETFSDYISAILKIKA